ncbi:RsmE family RNA methyltransferase [Mycoplasmopsis maculosa]|uniref:Ribosomal RNA small subunit methyltransferase E n=1 Tax=Mycoplasmopsis maculosa TaxID=114885 RepID=A0A449B3Z1_9BACT|nr:16S rRNA (uracil(1498)-N(3))-methyltransferase [Mycoplasmopsis maculosa]VEU75285.1 RsmE family RNA methyltransferase [Mycoplasmopsis maculosa]
MHRFFVKEKKDNYFILDESILKHIKIARLENDFFYCNYESEFYKCKLENKKALIIEKENINHEFNNEVILAAPIIKIKRYEWILQKATELGVTKIIPLNSKYVDQSLIKYDIKNKDSRFKEIIKNAAEQSFRNIIPEYTDVKDFKNVILENKNKKIYVAYELKNNEKAVNNLETNSLIIVGPEGGFTQEEIDFAIENNCEIVSLGKTILRAETACLYMLSNIKEK